MLPQLVITRGDTPSIPLPFTEIIDEGLPTEHEVPFDITDYSVRLMAKYRKTDADSAAKISIAADKTNPTGGFAIINFTYDDTKDIPPGKYFYDIQMVKGSFASNPNVVTVINDILIIAGDINQETA